MLAKVNYRIHTDAIKKHLVPKKISSKISSHIYADEADILNIALFGLSAKEWRDKNKGKEGNMRDYAAVEQLVVLVNLESFNAQYIIEGISQSEMKLPLHR